MENSHLGHFFLHLQIFGLVRWFSRPLRPTLRFCFGRVDVLGLWAWSDDLNVILLEFLDDDTKLAQSCRDWLCARRATDHDLESFSVVRKRVLGHVHVGQPTVILRVPAPGEWRIFGYVHH